MVSLSLLLLNLLMMLRLRVIGKAENDVVVEQGEILMGLAPVRIMGSNGLQRLANMVVDMGCRRSGGGGGGGASVK